MKYIYIHIIPHDSGKRKYIKIPIEIIVILLVILLFLFITSAIYIKININKIVSRHRVSVLKKETMVLKKFKEEMAEKLDSLNEEFSLLQGKTEEIEPMVEFEIGVPIKEVHNELTANIDSIYLMSKSLYADIKLVKREEGKIKNRLDFIPSIMPVKGWISVPYGQVKDPITEKLTNHLGITITAPRGSKVVATANGRVITIDENKELGKYVVLYHINDITTLYAHLSVVNVHEGDMVKRGETIGKTGETGRAVFNSVYYEVRIKGKPVNPEMYIIDE